MIHQVISSNNNVELLLELVDLELNLLALAADNLILIPSSETSTGNVEVSLHKLYSSDQAREVASWVTRTKKNKPAEYNNLFTSLLKFAAYEDGPAKQQFVMGIRHDIQLIGSPRPAQLQIAIERKSPEWQKAAQDFMLEFYEIFGTEHGFPHFLFKNSKVKGAFRRWEFIDNFTEANSSLRLCAVCDSTLYRTTIGDRPYTSIEHFFPKSRYPHLAVHPLNLIPICPNCNSGAAGAIDPFGDDNTDLLGLILPYQPGQQYRGLSEQTYICVKRSPDRTKHPFQLEMLPNKHYPDAGTLIANFERIYRVQERWNSELDWIDQHVFRRITQFLIVDVQSGSQLMDAHFLVERLELLMAIVSKDNLGQDPFGLATIWLIKHHIDSLQNSMENLNLVPIYAALQDWANSQQNRWQEYREHAKEVQQRVP